MLNLTILPFTLPGKIYRSPMPFGLYDLGKTTLEDMTNNHVTRVFTLVEEFEWFEKAGCNLPEAYKAKSISMEHFPVIDFGAPTNFDDFRNVIKQALFFAGKGENIAVHCNAGLGRTGTFLAVMAMEHFGWTAMDAILWVRQFIPGSIEGEMQVKYVLDWGKARNKLLREAQ